MALERFLPRGLAQCVGALGALTCRRMHCMARCMRSFARRCGVTASRVPTRRSPNRLSTAERPLIGPKPILLYRSEQCFNRFGAAELQRCFGRDLTDSVFACAALSGLVLYPRDSPRRGPRALLLERLPISSVRILWHSPVIADRPVSRLCTVWTDPIPEPVYFTAAVWVRCGSVTAAHRKLSAVRGRSNRSCPTATASL